MAIDLDKLRENWKKALDELDKMTPEELEKYFPKDTKPKGWISIEDHLPMMLVIDIMKGYSEYRVKYQDGHEDITYVTDHNIWYYRAKDEGITHWYND